MDAITRHAFTVFALQDTTSAVLAQNFFSLIMRIELLQAAQDSHFKAACFFLINEEREIPGRQKVVRGSSVPVLTSHVGLNPRSKSGYEREARVIKK